MLRTKRNHHEIVLGDTVKFLKGQAPQCSRCECMTGRYRKQVNQVQVVSEPEAKPIWVLVPSAEVEGAETWVDTGRFRIIPGEEVRHTQSYICAHHGYQ